MLKKKYNHIIGDMCVLGRRGGGSNRTVGLGVGTFLMEKGWMTQHTVDM